MHDAINDIGSALMQLQYALRKHQFKGVAAVDLMSPEDGAHLASLATPENGFFIEMGKMNPETGAPVNHVEIAGVVLRWPAQKRARCRSGFDWV